jgi:hypothetical protein
MEIVIVSEHHGKSGFLHGKTAPDRYRYKIIAVGVALFVLKLI